jgi:uncharacterized protein YbaP (TraB family)
MAGGEPALDEIIAHRAVEHGAKLVGLETVEDQLSVFSNMPLDQQATYLIATARMGDHAADYFETLINQYLRRKITLLIPLSRRLEKSIDNSDDSLSFIENDLIAKRNANMHRAALDLLARGNAFIAVGALHLPGTAGLVELIRSSGYSVTPVN